MSELLGQVDGIAGIAALVNGLVLWPVVRSLQKAIEEIRDEQREHRRAGGTRRGARR